jgi:hypothetical protein
MRLSVLTFDRKDIVFRLGIGAVVVPLYLLVLRDRLLVIRRGYVSEA